MWSDRFLSELLDKHVDEAIEDSSRHEEFPQSQSTLLIACLFLVDEIIQSQAQILD